MTLAQLAALIEAENAVASGASGGVQPGTTADLAALARLGG
jgi:hypothetical protein